MRQFFERPPGKRQEVTVQPKAISVLICDDCGSLLGQDLGRPIDRALIELAIRGHQIASELFNLPVCRCFIEYSLPGYKEIEFCPADTNKKLRIIM